MIEEMDVTTRAFYQPRLQHLDDAFLLFVIIQSGQTIEGAGSLKEALEKSSDMAAMLPLLVEAQFARKVSMGDPEPVFEFKITWKGIQFIELYRQYRSARLVSVEKANDLLIKLLTIL